ncbi:hypothetical protein A9K97_gp023 [Tokyovirus A1]|uniref:hypothetical protein n=1 Tax=Tokyovirus A1 TaxID=1826170 RepID=UPI0007A980B5|nr:hypothetical protein A9K97_gp023 [Tokyovirus A1]BAU80328.1 hypothetical protein [Tokyovirus A1]
MNERQKEHLLAYWAEHWKNLDVNPLIERRDDGTIVSFRFQLLSKDLIYPLCWCNLPKCSDCEYTEKYAEHLRIQCTRTRKCAFCT